MLYSVPATVFAANVPVTVTVEFDDAKYTVTLVGFTNASEITLAADSAGTLNFSNKQITNVTHDGTVKFTITPPSNKDVLSVVAGGQVLPIGGDKTYSTQITEDTTITVTYKAATVVTTPTDTPVFTENKVTMTDEKNGTLTLQTADNDGCTYKVYKADGSADSTIQAVLDADKVTLKLTFPAAPAAGTKLKITAEDKTNGKTESKLSAEISAEPYTAQPTALKITATPDPANKLASVKITVSGLGTEQFYTVQMSPLVGDKADNKHAVLYYGKAEDLTFNVKPGAQVLVVKGKIATSEQYTAAGADGRDQVDVPVNFGQ